MNISRQVWHNHSTVLTHSLTHLIIFTVFLFLDNPESIQLDSKNKGVVLRVAKKMEAYDTVFDLCNLAGLSSKKNTWPKKLFDYCIKVHDDYLKGFMVKLNLDKRTDEETLHGLVLMYKNHKIISKLLRSLFLAVEKFPSQNVLEETKESFKKIAFSDHKVCENCCNSMLFLINNERDGNTYNKALVQTVIKMFEEHELSFFYEPLIQGAINYYHDRRVKWFNDNFIGDYLKLVEGIISMENDRVSTYMYGKQVDELVKAVEIQLLFIDRSDMQLQVLKGIDALLENNRIDDIQRMFRLFVRYENAVKELSRLFKEFILRYSKERLDVASKRSASK